MKLLVRNRVKDFAAWKAIFDEQHEAAKESGLEVEALWQEVGDPGNVFFLMTVESMEKANAYMADPKSAEVGERSGVVDGECWFVE